MPDEHDDLLPLLEAVRACDERAARRLVERLGPLVLKIVRAHRPQRVAEEDLCQEVFMSVFNDLIQYRGSVPFERWVARIAVNTCYDSLRRERVRPELRFSDLSEAEAETVQMSLSQNQQAMESHEANASEVILKLLDTLPARERALMQWLGIDEDSMTDVADRLGWSAVRVKVTAFRIRRKLRATARKLIKDAKL